MLNNKKEVEKVNPALQLEIKTLLVQTLSVNTHTSVLFFSTEGLVYKLKHGKFLKAHLLQKVNLYLIFYHLKIINLLVQLCLCLKMKQTLKIIKLFLQQHKVKLEKIVLEDFSSINASGKIAMKLDNNDKIVGVKICQDDQDIILSTKLGKCIRFESKKLRVFKGRSSKGIKGIELAQMIKLYLISN